MLQLDASDTGLGGALLQDGQPVAFQVQHCRQLRSTMHILKRNVWPSKWPVQNSTNYLYGKQDVVLHSDHQPLETIFKKPLSKAPRRLQRMMPQLQPFKFTVVYKKGKYMYLAHTLSGAALNLPTPSDPQEEVSQCNSRDALDMFQVELQTIELNSPNMYPNTLEEIKAETEVDPSLSVLCAFVAHGWSSDKSQVPTPLRHYYPLRDEPAVYHGVLYKSHKVLIPLKLQSTLLKKLHQGHQGGESMIRRALEVMYWPGMQAAILQESANCSL